MSEARRGRWSEIQTQVQLPIIDSNTIFVVADRAFPPNVAKEVRRRDKNTCQGIDDWNGLDICAMQIIGIGGKLIPASIATGFEIDLSHRDHNRNKQVYFSAEGVRCQCKFCHKLFSEGIGHFSSAKKIGQKFVYLAEARDFRSRDRFGNIDITLRYPKDVADALAETLAKYGVEWIYDDKQMRCFPRIPDNWIGPGTREQIVDISHRLYVPKPIDIAFWASQR